MFGKYDPARRGTVTNLNEISDEFLAELRATGNQLESECLLRHCLPTSGSEYVRNFVNDVVYGGEDHRTWNRGGGLVLDWTIDKMLILTREELLAPIQTPGVAVEFLRRPAKRNWNPGSLFGSPAARRPDLDYTWKSPPHVLREREEHLEPLGDVTTGVRRWIATYLGWWVSKKGDLNAMNSVDEMFPLVNVEPNHVTDDGRAAAAGLLKERSLLAEDPEAIPGFCGPDEYFADR